MSDALESYFKLLSTGSRSMSSLSIVVDNAHVPSYIGIVDNPLETFSQSLSAMNSVPYPPPFLKDSCRWESMESSSTDISLTVPSRSREDAQSKPARGKLCPTSSLDSTERLLRELPLESPSGVPRQDVKLVRPRYSNDDLPSLKECPYDDNLETHPIVHLQCPRKASSDSACSCLGREDEGEVNWAYESSFDPSQEMNCLKKKSREICDSQCKSDSADKGKSRPCNLASTKLYPCAIGEVAFSSSPVHGGGDHPAGLAMVLDNNLDRILELSV